MDKPTPTPVVRAPSMASAAYEGDGRKAITTTTHHPRIHTTTLTRKISSKETGLSHNAHLLLGQTAAAVIASSFVSPAMTIVDLSIIRAQFTKTSITSSLRATASSLLRGQTPWNPALGIMNTVYLSTYLTANYTTSLCHEMQIDYKLPTAVATSVVNICAIAYKDREFARMCSKTPAVMPLASYGLFALRDGLTVTSSFVLKNSVKDHLQETYDMDHKRADLAASFSVPMLAQLFSTPLHILSLDLYTHPHSAFRMRMKEIAKAYTSVCSGRVMRIIPAFGVGGYVNDQVKEAFAEEKETGVVLVSQR